jgi:two-component system, cell cycle sensor histidine kinase and response regulator CckA
MLPASDQPVPNVERRTEDPAPRGEGTILLVEDEQALREVTRRILTAAGYQVFVAANGAEALEVASEHAGPIELLLSDVVMPQLAGPQLAERLLRVQPAMRILFMSGFAQPIIESGGHLEEGIALIEKPFSGRALLAKVAKTLERRG